MLELDHGLVEAARLREGLAKRQPQVRAIGERIERQPSSSMALATSPLRTQ